MGGGGASPLPPHMQARAGAVHSGKNYRTAPLVGPIMCRVAAANYRSALLMKSDLAPSVRSPGVNYRDILI